MHSTATISREGLHANDDRSRVAPMSWRAAGTVMLIVWGALSFGAVYPWAYLPLFAGCAVVGAAAWLERGRAARNDIGLLASLALLAVVVGLQLVPLSSGAIGWISPGTDDILRRFVIGYPASAPRHALSIAPGATALGLAALIALALLFLGLSHALTRDDTLKIARGVIVLGVVLALAGIVQKALWNGKIYGVWTPITAGESFGPFVNRNHFAGWMLMALPLALGSFCGRISSGMRHVKPGLRNRVIWLSSPDASETIMVGFAVILMALSLTLSMSRSGILGFLVALVISGWFVARRQATGSGRVLVAAYLVVVVFVAVGWTGYDKLAARFAEGETAGSGGRVEIWADSWRLAQKFPITGTGLNTFGSAMLLHQTVDLNEHLAEAHNDYLQLLAEGGALVCIPAAIAIVAVAATVRRRFRGVSVESPDYWIRVGAVTGIVAIAIQEAADFSLQMPGNAVLFALLLALAVRSPTFDRRIAS